MTLAALAAANAIRWSKAKVTRAIFAVPARRLVAAKQRYQAVARITGVPWYVVAVIHEREASQRWDASIAQGDPWNRVSTHVPRGRGPFTSWEAAAIDALTNCAPYAARWKDWSPGGTLTLLEQYNGLGYANMGRPSPYIWAGTDQYARGKYVADGKYDPSAVDSQPGCAGLLLAIAGIDPSVVAALGQIPAGPTPVPPKLTINPVSSQAGSVRAASIWQAALAVIAAIFRRSS